jgi:hypothetical protein
VTTKDEALQKALDALKLGAAMYSPGGTAHAQITAAITTCREALNKSDQDSFVVWVHPEDLQQARKNPHMCRMWPTQRIDFFVPLYNK